MLLLDRLREEQADIAAADDDQAARLPLLMPEGGERAGQMCAVGHEIDFVPDLHLVVARRHDLTIVADDAGDRDVDRKSVGWGKKGSVLCDLGGSGIIKKK